LNRGGVRFSPFLKISIMESISKKGKVFWGKFAEIAIKVGIAKEREEAPKKAKAPKAPKKAKK